MTVVPGSLYVILHGLTVVSERGPDLQIVLPDVPGHEQKAGAWLAETPIQKGSVMRLSGVNPGTKSVSQTDFSLNLTGTAVTSQARAATLVLPRPKEILGLLLAQDQAQYVARTKDLKTVFHKLATVTVLSYDYPDENEVALEGHYWEPAATGGAVTLHIVSTSYEPEDQAHEDTTEDVMSQVLRGYPGVEYRKPRPIAAPWIDPNDPNFGDTGSLKASGEYLVQQGGGLAFPLPELEYPASQSLRLARLARLKQGARPIGGLWRDPDFLSDRIANCVTDGSN
jgi:hypothetical protein